MGLRIFLRDWNQFAAKTVFGIVLEYFCKIGVGLKKFCPKRKEKRNWTWKIFVQMAKGERELDLK